MDIFLASYAKVDHKGHVPSKLASKAIPIYMPMDSYIKRAKTIDKYCNLSSCNMTKAPSYFDYEEEIYRSVFEGNEGGDLEDLDAQFAAELQFQETILISFQEISSSSSTSKETDTPASSSRPKPTPRKSAKRASRSTLSYCEICVDKKEKHEMFTILGCSHSFCADCISTYIKTRLEDNITIIMCPRENCGRILELEACMSRLPNEVITLWGDVLCEEELCATGGRLYCPFKDCSALLLNDNQGEIIAETECPNCHRLFCAQCNVPWHSGISCGEYQNLSEQERGEDDLLVRKLAKEKKWPNCPSCQMIVERSEGCPHMTCRCKYEFCYTCGAEWTHDHGGCQKD